MLLSRQDFRTTSSKQTPFFPPSQATPQLDHARTPSEVSLLLNQTTYIMFTNYPQHIMLQRIAELEHQIFCSNHNTQTLQAHIQQQNTEIEGLRTSLKDARQQIQTHIQINIRPANVAFSELKKSMRQKRRRDTEEVFRKVAEGIDEAQGGGGRSGIVNIRVEIQYDNGTTNTFWAKGGEEENNTGAHTDGTEGEDREQTDGQGQAAGAHKHIDTHGDVDRRVVMRDESRKSRKRRTYTPACIHKVLYIKTMHMLSYRCLHELRLAGIGDIPPKQVLLEESSRLSTCLDIFDINYQGKAVGARRRLQDTLEMMLKHPGYQHLLETGNDTLLLRFACDGAKIANNKDSVTGYFKILPHRQHITADKVSLSPADEFALFFYMGKEDRQMQEVMAKTTFLDMKEAAERGVVVNGRTFKVQWLLCCDWKALQLLRGINPANSHYFCLWCECTKQQILDFSVPDWPVTRSQSRQLECLASSEKKGYNNTDLLSFIPHTATVPDDLHLRMRITNKLLNQIVTWSILLKLKEQLVTEMKRIGVTFRFYEEVGDDNNGKINRWTQPTGDSLHTILTRLKLVNVFGHTTIVVWAAMERLSIADLKAELSKRGLPVTGRKKIVLLQRLQDSLQPGETVAVTRQNRQAVSYEFSDEEDQSASGEMRPGHKEIDVYRLQDVWDRFAGLVAALKLSPEREGYMSPQAFQDSARRWAVDFKAVTFNEDVIPYIHCLVYHVPQALKKLRYLPDIGVSQVERRNYDNHRAYFGATSREGGHKKKPTARQLLERENILMHFRLHPPLAEHSGPGNKRRKVASLDS